MNRINGYINLSEMVRNTEIKLESINDINELDSFTYNGSLYFFKPQPLEFVYNELVAEELLKDFNLPCASYDLAILGSIEGNITKNYREEGTNYIDGQVLLEEYIDYLDEEYPSEDNSYDSYMNNLTDIWNALEYRYRDNPNKEEIILKLMNKIVDLFIFDIITEHSDRHECNFEIMENDNIIDLAPIYDNERILYKNNYSSVSVDRDTNNANKEELEKFLNYSDYSYVDRIKDKLWIISPENLNEVFKRIEEKTQYPISEEIKERYIKDFETRKEKLEEELDKYSRKAK